MKNPGKMLLSLASLLIAGAVVRSLFTTDKGEEIKGKIVKNSKNVANSVNNAVDEGKENMEEMKDILKDNLNKMSSKNQQYS